MARQRFIDLGWKLLEHKYRYYILSKPIISDYDYDMLEKEYEQLAIQLNEPPTVTDMVDFDTSRHSCKSVMYKLQPKKKKR